MRIIVGHNDCGAAVLLQDDEDVLEEVELFVSCSNWPPGEAWMIVTLVARSTTNLLRVSAVSFVGRRIDESNGVMINNSPCLNFCCHSAGNWKGSSPRAGEMTMRCGPRRKMRRHSFSTGV